MAFKTSIKANLSPDKDAGWGLIYRLNNLWARVDLPAEHGDYDGWNGVLDRIYCNLLYRNKVNIVKDEVTGKIKEIKINEDAHEIYRFLTSEIFRTKAEYFKIQPNLSLPAKIIARSRWYHALMVKDVWLRKYMQELGLYLKEVEKSPGTALFGGG